MKGISRREIERRIGLQIEKNKKPKDKPITAQIGDLDQSLLASESYCHKFAQGTGCYRKIPVFYK